MVDAAPEAKRPWRDNRGRAAWPSQPDPLSPRQSPHSEPAGSQAHAALKTHYSLSRELSVCAVGVIVETAKDMVDVV